MQYLPLFHGNSVSTLFPFNGEMVPSRIKDRSMPAATSFHHVIMTPFNCKRTRNPADRKFDTLLQPNWLEHRFQLFERFCLPSVIHQTSQNFFWWIYFDKNTDIGILNRARKGIEGHPNFNIRTCDIFGSETARSDIAGEFGVSKPWILTTRLDNDDGLHHDHVRVLHENVRPDQTEALEFPYGVVYVDGAIYLSRQRHNAFISISEPLKDCKTVTLMRHKEIAHAFPVRIVSQTPAWLQTIHDLNVSNKIRGWRVSPKEIPTGFDVGDPCELIDVKKTAIFAENLTLGVARYSRDLMANTYHEISAMFRKTLKRKAP